MLLVEDARVGDQGREAVLVDAGQIVDRIAAVAGAGRAHLAHIGLCKQRVSGGEIVLHVLADVVAGNLLAPLLPEGGGAAAVRQDDDIALRSHQAIVPAGRPALRDGALRAAEADQHGGIFFGRIELRRIDHPGQHLLVIGGADPALLQRDRRELLQNPVVLVGELRPAAVGRGDRDNLRRPQHRAVGGQQAVAHQPQAAEVHPVTLRELAAGGGGQVGEADLLEPFHRGGEPEAGGGGVPEDSACVILEGGAQFRLDAGGEVHHEEALLVGLIAVAGHADPRDLAAVRREERFGVVARHALGKVLTGAGGDIIEVDVGVGGEGVLAAGQLAAGVGDLAAVRAEVELLDAAEGLGGQFERRTVQQVAALAQLLAVKGGEIRVRNALHEVVPVAVHHPGDGAGRGLGNIRIDVCRLGRHLEVAYIEYLSLVGRELELADSPGHVAHLAGATALGVSHPELTLVEVGDLLAALYPAGIGLAAGRTGDLAVVASVRVHHEEFAVALVQFDRGVGHAVEDLAGGLAVLRVAHLAQLVHDFRGELSVRHLDLVFFDQCGFFGFPAAGKGCCHGHHQNKYLFHISHLHLHQIRIRNRFPSGLQVRRGTSIRASGRPSGSGRRTAAGGR